MLSFLSDFQTLCQDGNWVIGLDYTKNSFVSSWPQKKTRTYFPRKSIFQWSFKPRKEYRVESQCPLDTTEQFKVWNGYTFLHDETMQLVCKIDQLSRMEIGGCCKQIRIASSNVHSLAMQHGPDKLGQYRAVGRMNQRLVYQQISGSNLAYSWQDKQGLLRWYVGSNMTLNGFESVQATNSDEECITDMSKFNVETKHPNHLFDTPQGWHFDPALRVECFEEEKSNQCCPTLEISSNSYGATFFPQLMGSYLMSTENKVSGRRVYVHTNGQYFIYMHDWGPRSGMEWIVGSPTLGSPNSKSIKSKSVEDTWPMNICFNDAKSLGSFSVWDGRKWRSDSTLAVTCTYFY